MTRPRAVHTSAAGITLAGERWDGGDDRHLVLMHAGICDSRSWVHVAAALTDLGTVWTYDRPGFGATPPAGPRDHVADAMAFLDANVAGPVWLVASSMGGAVALDVALTAPARVAGLVLLAPAISGAPEPSPTSAEQRLGSLIDDAIRAGDLDEANRHEIWFWLDGPEQDEGRVGGATRVLALEMNRTILDHGSEEEFDESVDAWHRLSELRVPVTVAVGDLDASFLFGAARHIAAQVDGATSVRLVDTAHLPYLDAPEQVVDVVRTALS